MRIRRSFFLIFFASNVICAQRAAQAGLISDNDLYTSTVYDRYYTNGLELFFRYQSKNDRPSINKKIAEFRLGQYFYNPQTRNGDDVLTNDRPFAGYLFLEAGINRYYQSESVLNTALQIGYVGPNSYAEEFQRGVHNLFNYKRVNGWQNQIRNALAVQANVYYSKKLAGTGNAGLHLQADAVAGTVLDAITISLMGRVSLKPLLPVYDSNIYGAALNSDPKKYREQSEFYFYIAPGMNYTFYDATIQGSMFSDSSPVTYDLRHSRFWGEAGLKYRRNNWDLSYSFNYRDKEARNRAIMDHFYGSIAIGYFLN